MSEGFLTDVNTMGLFFRMCRRYKIDDREGRIALLRKITATKRATYLRDVGEYIEGKTVLKITKREPQ